MPINFNTIPSTGGFSAPADAPKPDQDKSTGAKKFDNKIKRDVAEAQEMNSNRKAEEAQTQKAAARREKDLRMSRDNGKASNNVVEAESKPEKEDDSKRVNVSV